MNTRLVTDPVVECLLIAVFLSLAFWPGSAVSQVPAGWEAVSFEGETAYHFNGNCWKALAKGTASGLARQKRIDLAATPYLQWQWQASALPDWPDQDEQSKAGDDFQARVYVIKKGWLPWQTRAINYVWSRQYPSGSHWPNPFASQAHMVVVQGPGLSPEWQAFSRNVRDDFRRYHGVDIKEVDAVAIMTDGDNTGSTVSACYRLPAFQAQP
ncbi:DUF3047 domain-containing protein [Alcanivorax sp. DP30]|uniref:DUF3047 domain-containing protein n=1 Tax=Alcanivorax sp. DP30 TaxID=2606217 RepID=UPI00137144E5|nr:DUF3047 domain-containing protein [Alcanivorax sp. DP30]MZR64110.1 DUF3047 domain-containing protein [Alcanivorax sp. DP30]